MSDDKPLRVYAYRMKLEWYSKASLKPQFTQQLRLPNSFGTHNA
jgi:hypothetical protein